MQNQSNNCYGQCSHSPTGQSQPLQPPGDRAELHRVTQAWWSVTTPGELWKYLQAKEVSIDQLNKGQCTQEPVFRRSLQKYWNKNPHPYFILLLKVQPWNSPQSCQNKRSHHSWSGGFPKGVSWLKVAEVKAPGGRGRLSVPCALSLHPMDNPCPPQGTCLGTCGKQGGRTGKFSTQISSSNLIACHRQSSVQIMEREEWDRSEQGGRNANCLFKTLSLFMPCSYQGN